MKHQDFPGTGSRRHAVRRGSAVTCLVVPGLDGSGPDHWQSLWERTRTDCARAELGCWSDPHLAVWRDGLDRAVSGIDGRVVLAAHSLGCFAVAWWAASASASLISRVQGALLVAPPDVEKPGVDPRLTRFAPTPSSALPFRSILVASANDPYASPLRSREMAATWGAEFVDLGEAGHINAKSRIGFWPAGQALLEDLIHRSGRA